MPQTGIQRCQFLQMARQFGGMDVSEARRLRDLEGENAKLKKLLAEAHLDMEALKTAFGAIQDELARNASA
jgi:putative transposase